MYLLFNPKLILSKICTSFIEFTYFKPICNHNFKYWILEVIITFLFWQNLLLNFKIH